jgi:AbrB family looped-hinge helix DNA binding protein
MITQLREKSQITIPKDLIKKLNLKTGDNIEINIENYH